MNSPNDHSRLQANVPASQHIRTWPVRIASWMRQQCLDHYSSMTTQEVVQQFKNYLDQWFTIIDGADGLSKEARQHQNILDAARRIMSSYWGPDYRGPLAPPSVEHFSEEFLLHASTVADFVFFRAMFNPALSMDASQNTAGLGAQPNHRVPVTNPDPTNSLPTSPLPNNDPAQNVPTSDPRGTSTSNVPSPLPFLSSYAGPLPQIPSMTPGTFTDPQTHFQGNSYQRSTLPSAATTPHFDPVSIGLNTPATWDSSIGYSPFPNIRNFGVPDPNLLFGDPFADRRHGTTNPNLGTGSPFNVGGRRASPSGSASDPMSNTANSGTRVDGNISHRDFANAQIPAQGAGTNTRSPRASPDTRARARGTPPAANPGQFPAPPAPAYGNHIGNIRQASGYVPVDNVGVQGTHVNPPNPNNSPGRQSSPTAGPSNSTSARRPVTPYSNGTNANAQPSTTQPDPFDPYSAYRNVPDDVPTPFPRLDRQGRHGSRPVGTAPYTPPPTPPNGNPGSRGGSPRGNGTSQSTSRTHAGRGHASPGSSTRPDGTASSGFNIAGVDGGTSGNSYGNSGNGGGDGSAFVPPDPFGSNSVGGGVGGPGNNGNDQQPSSPLTPPRLLWLPSSHPPNHPIPYTQCFPQGLILPNVLLTPNPDTRFPGPAWEPGIWPPIPLGHPVAIRVHHHLLPNPVELSLPVLQWDITQAPEKARVLTGKSLLVKPYIGEPAVVCGDAVEEHKIHKIWIESDDYTLAWWMKNQWGPLIISKEQGKELTVWDVLEGIYQYLAKPLTHWDYEKVVQSNARIPATYSPGTVQQLDSRMMSNNLGRLKISAQRRMKDLGSLDIPGSAWKGQWARDVPLPDGVPYANQIPMLSYDFRRSDVLGSTRKFVGLRPMVQNDGTWALFLGLAPGGMVKV
ncbi:hypothetical protein VKT23_013805 [Stygiomarasmius scandens]|uniref:DUF6699 domain-containing protein n=1 Tax=Marasmiellus scandens TaxID=2682957 RepID=A0ABR1J1T8_9AGAR